jgi:hypothetical protein
MRLVNPAFVAFDARLSTPERVAFRAACGLTVTYMSQLKCGYRVPSLALAQKIAFHSAGLIPLDSWPLPPELITVRARREPVPASEPAPELVPKRGRRRKPVAAADSPPSVAPLEFEHAAG